MTKPQFSMNFNLGHLLQITSLIVAVTVGWMRMDALTSENSRKISDTAESIRSLSANHQGDRVRIRNLETTTARADERMQSIYAILSRIDGRLERMEDRNE